MWIIKGLPGVFLVLIQTSCFMFGFSNEFLCPEVVFQSIPTEGGRPLEEDILSTHLVTSWIECGNKCLENKDCVTFSHIDSQSYDINCKINEVPHEFVVKSQNDSDNDDEEEEKTWKTYKLIKSGICATLHPCQNAGSCIKDFCEPEGYSCLCSQWYYGKHCENENRDFDVHFQSQHPVQSYIEMDDIVKSDLSEFTFTVWFKISMKLNCYQLLSYMVNGEDGHINLHFKSEANRGIRFFVGQVAQISKPYQTYIIPVNDDVWHHLGFAWSNVNGRWDVLVDGTPRAIRNGVKTGATIPAGGRLVIGQEHEGSKIVDGKGLLGQISGVNLWDRALLGEELDSLAKTPNAGRGNILRWFQVLRNIHGALEIVAPSKSKNTNAGLNFELHFDSNSSGHILAPGPKEPLEQLTVCFWLKISVGSTFVSYHVKHGDGPAFSFGMGSAYHLFAHINGDLVNSTIMKDVIVNNHWHFLCLTWDARTGVIIFYHQGSKMATHEKNCTSILQGGHFLIGATKHEKNGSYLFSKPFIGTLSCLNIWSARLVRGSIASMSSGAMNVNGDVLAWRNVLHLIVNNVTTVLNTIIYYPGKIRDF